MHIDFFYRSFEKLKSKTDLGFKDPYHIMSSLNDKMREAVLNNPSGYEDNETCQILALDGEKVVGACNPFSGRMISKGKTMSVQNGSYLFAHEDYRKENVGGELFMRIAQLHPNKDNLFAGISQMAIGLYRAMKFTVFEFPRLIYLRKSRSVVHAFLKTESPIVAPVIWLVDACLFIHRKFLYMWQSIRYSSFKIQQVEAVPQEVEDIFYADTHSYKELHDKKWMEWSLKYSLSEDTRNIKRLYVVEHNNIIEAFFLIKQEFFKQASNRGFRNVYLGSVMEWGISEDSRLKESDLYLMSIGCFDNTIDGIQIATSDHSTVSRLHNFIFVNIGTANMGFKFKSIKDPDVNDINNWRTRLAISDTLIN